MGPNAEGDFTRVPSGRRPARSRSRIAAGACALVITAVTAGCSSASAVADPPQASGVPSDTTSDATPPSAAASTAPAADASADLVSSLDGRAASVRVSVGPVTSGVPPVETTDGDLTEDCGLDQGATEYSTVSIVFSAGRMPTKETPTSSNLRLDLSVAGGDRVGLIEANVNQTDYCTTPAVLPPETTLQSQNLADQHQTMTLYVVARIRQPASDPLRGVTVQLHGPRHHPDSLDSRPWTWGVQSVTAGSACPGDPNSLCVPIG
jgi:hypothetical protein